MYNLLEQFTDAGIIRLTKSEGRRKSYQLTGKGRDILEAEYERLNKQMADYRRFFRGEDE